MKNKKDKLLFLTIFTVISFAALQIPFNKLAGSNVSFTLFDFFAPIAGAFLGPFFGVGSVLAVEVANMFFKQTPWAIGPIIRLFPTLFAVFYFATVTSKKYNPRWILLVPLLSIFVFLAHPNGKEVPYYTLFWLIPLIAFRFRSNLFMKSLGATFTAHSVGGAAWIWAFNLKAVVWNSLIPLVIAERLLFALGISASFIVIRYTLSYLAHKKILPKLDLASN